MIEAGYSPQEIEQIACIIQLLFLTAISSLILVLGGLFFESIFNKFAK